MHSKWKNEWKHVVVAVVVFLGLCSIWMVSMMPWSLLALTTCWQTSMAVLLTLVRKYWMPPSPEHLLLPFPTPELAAFCLHRLEAIRAVRRICGASGLCCIPCWLADIHLPIRMLAHYLRVYAAVDILCRRRSPCLHWLGALSAACWPSILPIALPQKKHSAIHGFRPLNPCPHHLQSRIRPRTSASSPNSGLKKLMTSLLNDLSQELESCWSCWCRGCPLLSVCSPGYGIHCHIIYIDTWKLSVSHKTLPLLDTYRFLKVS